MLIRFAHMMNKVNQNPTCKGGRDCLGQTGTGGFNVLISQQQPAIFFQQHFQYHLKFHD